MNDFNLDDIGAPSLGRMIKCVSQSTGQIRPLVKVAGLGHEDFLVELTPISVVPPDRY